MSVVKKEIQAGTVLIFQKNKVLEMRVVKAENGFYEVWA